MFCYASPEKQNFGVYCKRYKQDLPCVVDIVDEIVNGMITGHAASQRLEICDTWQTDHGYGRATKAENCWCLLLQWVSAMYYIRSTTRAWCDNQVVDLFIWLHEDAVSQPYQPPKISVCVPQQGLGKCGRAWTAHSGNPVTASRNLVTTLSWPYRDQRGWQGGLQDQKESLHCWMKKLTSEVGAFNRRIVQHLCKQTGWNQTDKLELSS